jgi:adenine/guanine phosphoribosyltransferase-like PRPP-binding protein
LIPQKVNNMAHPSWLANVYDPQKLTIVLGRMCAAIEGDKKKFDIRAIAVRGNSGTLVAGAVSMMTGLPIILVRKEGDGSHSDFKVEYSEILKKKGASGYIIIDDIVASGNTIKTIRESIKDHLPLLELKKVYLYDGYGRSDPIRIGTSKAIPVESFGN